MLSMIAVAMALIELAHPRKPELPEQMTGQGFGFGARTLEVVTVEVRRAMVDRHTVVDILPGGIDGQFRGNVPGRHVQFWLVVLIGSVACWPSNYLLRRPPA